jgi:hypothetical protein
MAFRIDSYPARCERGRHDVIVRSPTRTARPHAYVVASVNERGRVPRNRGPFQTHRFRPRPSSPPPLAVATFSLRAGLPPPTPTTRGARGRAPRPANLSSSPPPPLVLRRLMTIYIESRLHNHHGPSIDDESHESRLVRACVRTQPRDTDRRRRPQLLLLLRPSHQPHVHVLAPWRACPRKARPGASPPRAACSASTSGRPARPR